MNHFPHVKAGFDSTCWSVILGAAGVNETGSQKSSLERLYCAYVNPLYAFARGRGFQPDDAMDLVHGFFVHVVEKDSFKSVSPEKGRFRSFLLAALKNYIANHRRYNNAERRGGKILLHSIDQGDLEKSFQESISDRCTPDSLFNQCWLETLLNNVLLSLRLEYERAEKIEIYEAIIPYLEGELPRHEIARQLRMSSAAVAMSLSRMRIRYREILYSNIAETVCDPAETEDELNRLFEIAAERFNHR